MASDLSQLSVTLTAKIDDFQSSMKQAGQDFDRQASQIEDRNRQMTSALAGQMQNVGAGVQFLATTIKGLISVATVEALITAFGRARESLAAMNKQAQETRLTVEQLASLKFVGAGFGAGNDDINKALAFFTEQSKKTTEDARGLYQALAQIGPQFKQAFIDAPTQTERLNVVSRAMHATTDETKRAQLSLGAFGTDNERVMATVDSVNGSLSTLVERARAAGISVSTDLAERADDAEKKLATLHEVIADKLTVALSNLAELLIRLVPSFGSLATALEPTRREIEGIVNAYNTLSQAAALFSATGHIPLPSQAAAAARASEYVEPGSLPEGRPLTVGPGNRQAFQPRENLAKKPKEATEDEYDREQKRINKLITSYTGQAAAVGKVGEAAAKAEASTRLWEAADEAKLAHTPALAKQIDDLAEKYAKVKANLEKLKLAADLAFEAQQLGRTADEQAVYSRLRGASIDPDSEAGQRLANQMRVIQGLTEGKEMAGSFVKGLISDLENGVKAGKALENQLKRIADKLLDKAIDSALSGLFRAGGGIFGDLFTPAAVHAQGGVAGTGPQIMVPTAAFAGARHFAEGGGIPAILHAGELVLNAAQQRNVADKMGGGPTVNYNPTINGSDLTKEQLLAVLSEHGRQIVNKVQRNFGPMQADYARRHG